MLSVDQFQAYLRHSAQRSYQSVSVPPFTLFMHPRDNLIYFNYAIPDMPIVQTSGELNQALATLQGEFQAFGRTPRFEFMYEYAPGLPSLLEAAGFTQEARQQFMVCTPETFRPAPPVPGLAITQVRRESLLHEALELLAAQRRGFDPAEARPVTEAEAAEFLHGLDGTGAFVARLDGEPVAAGMHAEPLDGVAEVFGLATLEAFRRRGVATTLTAHIAAHVFAAGAQVACLTAADERAGRVYERVGFQPYATMLAYSANARSSSP